MSELRNRIVQLSHYGEPDELQVVEAPLPVAGPGEVRVRVLASGIEYTDVVIRRHLYAQTMLRRLPFVMGYDVVGEIDQLGDGVSDFQIGDRVADMTVVGRMPPIARSGLRTCLAYRPASMRRRRPRSC
jgi:NADPH:quinone reductase